MYMQSFLKNLICIYKFVSYADKKSLKGVLEQNYLKKIKICKIYNIN